MEGGRGIGDCRIGPQAAWLSQTRGRLHDAPDHQVVVVALAELLSALCPSMADSPSNRGASPPVSITDNPAASLLQPIDISQSDFPQPDLTQGDTSKAVKKSDLPPPYQVLPAWTEPERDTWNKKVEFLLAVIGFAVDLGNVWRFPYICYQNGGGAFLIPYVIMLVFGGLPLFFMELALGQYHRNGCLTVWKRICPMMKGIGYAICIIDFYMAMYYNTILAWSVYYLIASFGKDLPWNSCGNPWNTEDCTLTVDVHNASDKSRITSPAKEYFRNEVLQINESSGLNDVGPIKMSLAACLFSVFLLVYFSLWKGVKSTGKAVWVTALAPYVVLLILLVRGVTLPGAHDGIIYYLKPRFEMLDKPKVWIDAATQIFFSLGPGFGTLLALSSYNKFNNNCYRDALLTSSINCLTSFLAGFVIFSVLGYMAHVLHKDISEVGEEGSGLVFTVYPEALATMSGSVFWSIIFFLMLITLGLDSTFGGLEAMITGLCDEYPKVIGRHREKFVALLLCFIYICALPTTTYVLFICSFAFGGDEEPPDNAYNMCTLPDWAVSLGWVLTCSSIMCIPLYIIYMFAITKGSVKERVKLMIKPEEFVHPEAANMNFTYGTRV